MLHQRSSESHALLLTAGQLMRVATLEAFQADQAEHVLHTHFPLAPAQPAQAEGDVLLNTEVGEQRVLLKHHADVSVFGRYHLIRRRHQLP